MGARTPRTFSAPLRGFEMRFFCVPVIAGGSGPKRASALSRTAVISFTIALRPMLPERVVSVFFLDVDMTMILSVNSDVMAKDGEADQEIETSRGGGIT